MIYEVRCQINLEPRSSGLLLNCRAVATRWHIVDFEVEAMGRELDTPHARNCSFLAPRVTDIVNSEVVSRRGCGRKQEPVTSTRRASARGTRSRYSPRLTRAQHLDPHRTWMAITIQTSSNILSERAVTSEATCSKTRDARKQ